ncbi:major facilitator superfamily domain-containing protein [Massariosphaeria phaeospora]|uniref:Major facilitator superfamily domain-containing protein n=1 Tax=Massariosphaeria phaeospora TaxID=100035 RepID=A0A7C8IAX5_9PLEO|nr:major facilitator superfamily domain-containing protein [Massariosphaeria phaeospora]
MFQLPVVPRVLLTDYGCSFVEPAGCRWIYPPPQQLFSNDAHGRSFKVVVYSIFQADFSLGFTSLYIKSLGQRAHRYPQSSIMASTTFHGLFDIQPTSTPPEALELDTITLGKPHDGPSAAKPQSPKTPTSGTHTPHEQSAPMSPSELEMSRPPTPRRDEVNLIQRWNDPPANKWRILACCLIYFGNGINDSVVGALIPYMEAHYQIQYAIMSMVFVGNAAGFIVAAFFTNTTLNRLGRAKTLVLAELLMLVAYIILVTTPPYPAVIVSFFLLGYGMAINIALNNVFCANIHPPSVILGVAHGSYGIGGTVAPIIGTAMVSKGIMWSRFYLLPLGIRLFCIAFAGWAFWSYREESPPSLLTVPERTASRQAASEEVSKLNNLKLALQNRVTVFGALFIFAYQGAEVSISGWVISFLITYRGGDPASVGYVTAGFWAGITLGRFVLTHAAPRIGEKNYVAILTLGSLVLQLLAWLIPNVIGNAVAVSALGLLLGPVYPCAQTIFLRLLPRHVQTTAMGFIAGAGSSGGAVAPFTTGILAQAAGTWVLHPVCVGLYVVMMACWVALPRVRKRTE